MLSSYYVGLGLGATTLGALFARVGHIRVFAAVCAIAGVSVTLLGLVDHPAGWLLLRPATGYATAGIYVCVESWLNARTTTATRGALLAAYMIAVQLALAGGQGLAVLFPPSHAQVFAVGALLHVAALIPVALTRLEQPSMPSSERYDFAAMVRRAPLGLLGTFVAGVGTALLVTVGPVYATRAGHSVTEAAVFMAVMMAAGLLPQVPVGRLSDRIGRRPVLAATGFLLAGTALLLAFGPSESFPILLAGGAVIGGLVFVLYPLGAAYANDRVEPHEIVMVGGTLILSFSLGAISGPLLGGAAMTLVGGDGFLVALGLPALLMGALCAVPMGLRRRVDPADRVDYLPVMLPQAVPSGEMEQAAVEESLDTAASSSGRESM